MSNGIRKTNIELLRIISIFAVIILHYNNPLYGKALSLVNNGSLNFYFLNFIESLCACAVNIFLIITGYFMCKSNKINFWKPILLILQVIVFKSFLYIISSVLITKNFNFLSLISSCIPSNYFVILYCTLIIICPFINIIFNNLSIKKMKIFVLIIFILFSVYPNIADIIIEISNHNINGLSTIGMYGSQYGYTIVNFVLMYLLGAYIKNVYDDNKFSKKKLLLIILSNTAILTIWSLFYNQSALEYCNPLIIINAVSIFLLFKNINISYNKIINKFSKGTFSVFLLHITFIKYIKIDHFVNQNIFVLIIHILLSCIILYFICFIVYYIYDNIINVIIKKIKNKYSLILKI